MRRLVPLLLGLLGCSGPSTESGGRLGGVGESCRRTADCEDPLLCVDSVCFDPYGGDADADADGDADADADGDADADTDTDTDCGQFDFVVEPGPPPDLLLVVDRSGSMDDSMPGGGRKWNAMLAAVDAVTHALEDRIDFGLTSFPSGGGGPFGGGSCAGGGVILDPEPGNADEIVGRLTDDGIGGGTPTALTLQESGDYFGDERDGHEEHAPVILLATDGAPNCNAALDPSTCDCTGPLLFGECGSAENCLDDDRTYDAIDDVVAGPPPVPVYVVGLPGVEEFEGVLSEMARRGGTARVGDPAYYEATDADALEAALAEIAGGLVLCVFELDEAPDDPRRVRVTVDGEDVPHTDDESDGWAFADAGNTVLEILGTWCDRLQDGEDHTVSATYECEKLW